MLLTIPEFEFTKPQTETMASTRRSTRFAGIMVLSIQFSQPTEISSPVSIKSRNLILKVMFLLETRTSQSSEKTYCTSWCTCKQTFDGIVIPKV